MKRDLTYWRFVYQTGGGWRGVRWCLNCLYGPRAWKRIAVDSWRNFRMRQSFKRMSPAERADVLATLEGLSHPSPTGRAAGGEVERLRKALEPFAKAADDLEDDRKDGSDIWEAPAAMNITAGDLRAARQALESKTHG